MKKKIFLFFNLSIFTLFFISSCKFYFNDNGYQFLSEEDRIHFRPFTSDIINKQVSYNDSLFIYEITSDQIKEVAKGNKNLWVNIWNPVCNAERCLNINYFSNIEKKYKEEELRIMLVSSSYEWRMIKKIIDETGYSKPVYVLSNSYYGNNKKKNLEKLAADFQSEEQNKKVFTDFLFCNSLLVHADWNMEEDSLSHFIMKR